MLCEIFKSSRQEEMYLYVERSRGVEDVPEDLLKRFGELIPVMVLPLSLERKLARADVVEVLACIEKQGFYLQMPPTMAELLARESSRG
ncbi:Protein YcgL [Halioglobus japonicus]|nr:Protein YcgL [Halioglobus japonicus]